MAYHGHWNWLARVADDLRPFFQHRLRIVREQADHLLAIALHHGRASERTLSDEVLCRFAYGPTQPRVVRRHRAVGFLADDDITLFRAQHVHRLGAVGSDVVSPPLRHDGFPDRAAIAGRDIHFKAEFAGKGQTEQERPHPADAA